MKRDEHQVGVENLGLRILSNFLGRTQSNCSEISHSKNKKNNNKDNLTLLVIIIHSCQKFRTNY